MWPSILTRTTGATLAARPSHTLFFWLIGAFLLTLLPHVTQLPGWLTTAIIIAVTFRIFAELKRWPLPSTASTGVVALCLLGGIYLQYHTVLGRDAGTPFMAGLLAIKFFELRGPRDITLIIFASFFVVMSALLFSQAIELFVYCLIMMWLLTGILLRTHMGDRPGNTLLHMLRSSSLIFLQALPFALFLFFFLPRYTGRFQLSFNDTVIGLSDRVEPGSIAKLSQDDSPALRVKFPPGVSIPTPDTMYWRAIVLWDFDGKAWTRGKIADLIEPQAITERDSDEIVQDIVIMPQNQKWIPALDRPISPASDMNSSGNFSTALMGDVLVTGNSQPIDYKRHYTVTSSSITEDQTLTLGSIEEEASLELPENKVDARVRELAHRLNAPYAARHDTRGFINAVLHYFRQEGFSLTTEPGTLPHDPVAQFLFKTRKGFCEHYASAFAVLMRCENIPTRMVVGYHGGELNTYGSFYQINQANAHAWDEVWVASKKNWERVDPTSAITIGTPRALAVNTGVEPDDDLSFQLSSQRFTLLSGNSLPPWLRHSIRDLAMRRQEMEAQWDDWVFSYDPGTQDRLAQWLGLGRQAGPALLLGCLVGLGLGGAVFAFIISRKKKLEPVEAFYARLCRTMAQRGAPRDPWEGPLAYTKRLAETFPARSEPIQSAGWIVARTRYGSGTEAPPAPGELDALLGLIAAPDRASSSRERS